MPIRYRLTEGSVPVTRLASAHVDQTYQLELRKLLRVDLLIIDDLTLQALDQTETQDFYEIVVECHRVSSTIVASNREPGEWLDVMAEPMLAQSAVDRLQNSAYELVVEGESYRKRQKPGWTGEEVSTGPEAAVDRANGAGGIIPHRSRASRGGS